MLIQLTRSTSFMTLWRKTRSAEINLASPEKCRFKVGSERKGMFRHSNAYNRRIIRSSTWLSVDLNIQPRQCYQSLFFFRGISHAFWSFLTSEKFSPTSVSKIWRRVSLLPFKCATRDENWMRQIFFNTKFTSTCITPEQTSLIA